MSLHLDPLRRQIRILEARSEWHFRTTGKGASSAETVRQFAPPSAFVPRIHLVIINTVGHIADNCTSDQRLCYNCRQPGHELSACPSPRTVASKQCYSCGGVGHIQAECPSLRLQGGVKCYVSSAHLLLPIYVYLISFEQNCGRFGHISRMCPGAGAGFASRAPPPGRGLNTSALPPVKCYRCGGPNHLAKYMWFTNAHVVPCSFKFQGLPCCSGYHRC